MMKRMDGIALAALFALGACSGAQKADDADAASGESAPASSEAATGLTPEYLAGDWCYLRFEAGDEVSEENINYVFAADGTLKYQTNSSTPVDQDGSFEITDGAFVVKPALGSFKLKPVTVDDGEMVFSAMGGQFFWSRGACPA